MKKVPCQKRMYHDEAAARAAASTQCKLGEHHMMWVYRCETCERWHLTRSKQHKSPPATADNPYFDYLSPYTTYPHKLNYTKKER